jgi:predicted  nucleic acid-binding Zn-ribbon protein
MKNITIKKLAIFLFIIIVPVIFKIVLMPLYAQVVDPQKKRAELQARAVLKGVKNAILAAEKEIIRIESRESTIQDLLAKIKEAENEIQRIKDQNKITPLETQIEAHKIIIDQIAQQIFANSIAAGTNESLYLPISKYIKDITDNPIIKRRLLEIFEAIQEIKNQMGNAKQRIRETGRQISSITRPQKLLIKQEQAKMLPIQEEIDKIRLREDINNRLETLYQRIREYKNQIENEQDELTEEDKDQIEKFQNVKRRYELILEFLRDPDKIQTITDEELIGLTPVTEND